MIQVPPGYDVAIDPQVRIGKYTTYVPKGYICILQDGDGEVGFELDSELGPIETKSSILVLDINTDVEYTDAQVRSELSKILVHSFPSDSNYYSIKLGPGELASTDYFSNGLKVRCNCFRNSHHLLLEVSKLKTDDRQGLKDSQLIFSAQKATFQLVVPEANYE